jgi:hypothetical protein
VFVGGSLAARDGPLGGGRAAEKGETGSVPADDSAATTASLPTLGSISDQLARLPPVVPGELAGVLDLGTADCSPDHVDLSTLERASTHADICAAPGAKFGIRKREATDEEVIVRDLDGRRIEAVGVPSGWFFSGFTRQGIVFCDDGGDAHAHGRLRRFLGSTTRLPSCPLTQTRDGRLLFASADHRSVIDERGRRVLTMAGHLPQVPDIRQIGDGLFAVNTELYRDGRRIASYGTEGVSILGASSDGSVALLQRDGTGELVVYRDGVSHALGNELTGDFPSGVVAPDGRRILLQRDREGAIVIDAATRRPLSRLDIVTGAFVFDWRPAAA